MKLTFTVSKGELLEALQYRGELSNNYNASQMVVSSELLDVKTTKVSDEVEVTVLYTEKVEESTDD